MTAGHGQIHNEIPAEGVTVHSLQLWINLPAADKMTSPRYQDLAGDAVSVRQPGVEIRVFSRDPGYAGYVGYAPIANDGGGAGDAWLLPVRLAGCVDQTRN
jgi:redox-sensitive bicupin YhaK (pirin superfamily)